MLRKLLMVVLPLMLPTLIYMAYMMIDAARRRHREVPPCRGGWERPGHGW